MSREKITHEQFAQIFDLLSSIQEVCPDADTSSVNMWLTMVAPEGDPPEMSASRSLRMVQLVAREAVFRELLDQYKWTTPNHKAVLDLAYRETLKEMKSLGLEEV